MKRVFSAFAVLAIVGSALAFAPKGQGSVFCETTCTTLKDYQIDPNGNISAPCGRDASTNPLPVYQLSGSSCVQIAAGTKFSATQTGN